MSCITLTGVTKRYGNVQVIQAFSGVIGDGEFVTLLGPSGCGKTTMLRMIAGFEKPTSGEIRIGDAVVSGPGQFIPPNMRGIGMVFQTYAVWPHMNVFDNVAYPLKIQGIPRAEAKHRVESMLEAMHLGQYAKRLPSELSGGQQQRVALGRALVSKPSVLLLDEPLSNLDAKLRESMRFEIKELQKQSGITVVYVTHDQSEAMAMSDRIIVFHKGAVQQADTPVNIYNSPANPFVADFVGKINFLRCTACAGSIIFDGGQRMNYTGARRGSVILAVRPENIRLSTEGGLLHGTLAHVYYLGDITDCRVVLNGICSDRGNPADIRVIAPGQSCRNLAPGTQVWLDFRHYLLFDEA